MNFIIFAFRSEIERNRSKVLEISHFLDVQRQEFANILDT